MESPLQNCITVMVENWFGRVNSSSECCMLVGREGCVSRGYWDIGFDHATKEPLD